MAQESTAHPPAGHSPKADKDKADKGDTVTVTGPKGTVVHTKPEVAERLRRRGYS